MKAPVESNNSVFTAVLSILSLPLPFLANLTICRRYGLFPVALNVRLWLSPAFIGETCTTDTVMTLRARIKRSLCR